MKQLRILTIGFIISLCLQAVNGQGFLHAKGDSIVDGSGENFLIRSIGTGNWMITEGYMMQAYPGGGSHTGFRNKLIEEMGVAKTDSFYTSWLNNHVTKADIDSMAAWGFNSIRPALHYKWFTLPIEDEPVAGDQTWIETGFSLIDSLVKWCGENQMYIILDMHGAPGGQGAEGGISDYDPTKPSLWEDEDNKTKLAALWKRIAERYSDEQWIGGYDLINEVNWDLPGGTDLRNLYERITDSIRLVDQNHIIFIEGNWFANDFTGLTPPWDDNMAYSFHKYWSPNDPGSLGYGTWLRDTYNVPVWLGETGENSNVWFTSLIAESEKENVGWSFWPIKKGEVDNVLRVEFNEDYYEFKDNWDSGDALNPEEAFQAMMTFSERHRIENCIVQFDVIDAMMRQPHSNELKPYNIFAPTDKIFASDYALGRLGFAYYDQDSAQLNGIDDQNTGNNGYSYRNDAVDIETCEDTDLGSGYNVGWTNDGEWMIYHVETDSAMLVDATFRSASGSSSSGGAVLLEANGNVISESMSLPLTGGWQSYASTTFSDIILPAGMLELKLRIVDGGSNLNYFSFSNPRSPAATQFKSLFAETSVLGNKVFIHLNGEITAGNPGIEEFSMKIGTKDVSFTSVKAEEGSRLIELEPDEIMPTIGAMFVSYTGSSIEANGSTLLSFTDLRINNILYKYKTIPGKIQAEDFYYNMGFSLEECEDTGGGQNTAYSDNGDYMDYVVNVNEAKEYSINMRVALQNGSATIQFLYENEEGEYTMINNMTLSNTGGWQNWQTQTSTVELPEGKYRFRIKSLSGEHNINWFEFEDNVGIESLGLMPGVKVYPNPATDFIYVEWINEESIQATIELIDNLGRTVYKAALQDRISRISTDNLDGGIYIFRIKSQEGTSYSKVIIR